MNNHFTVLIPSYNAGPWTEKNLNSVFNQDYKNYDVFYIDDYSTDNTARVAQDIFYDSKFNGFAKIMMTNTFNKGKMDNVYDAITSPSMREDTIVVILDGDDWLANESVLSKLNEVYTKDVWMTNGSYRVHPTGEVISPIINEDYWNSNIRKKSWQFSHLGTFRKKLFLKVKKRDFMTKDGMWYQTTSDQAIMWPMAEMAGPDHFVAIKDVLYIYNRTNPLSDDRVHRQDQLQTELEIRNKKPYERLTSL
tara:strand:+ start:179 stop:928 length:750 start_codon:yes stop_codon:yes gene_type:complete